ncbi:hypothetical protein IJG66_00395 [Candidatus Saccharibacteria bacterium]|nr:hypothetical protein [Candidatus Saccharibacteria bacterium]
MKITVFVACLLALLAIVAGATNVGLIVNRKMSKLCIGKRRCRKAIPGAVGIISAVLFYITLLTTVHTAFVAYLDSLPGAATAIISGTQTSLGLLLLLAAAYGYILYYVAKTAERFHHDVLDLYLQSLEDCRLQTCKELRRSGEIDLININ